MHWPRCWLMWGPGRSASTFAPGHRDDDTGLCRPGEWGAWPTTTQSRAKGRQPHPSLQGEIRRSYPKSSSYSNRAERATSCFQRVVLQMTECLKQFHFLITLVPPKQCNERPPILRGRRAPRAAWHTREEPRLGNLAIWAQMPAL